MLANIKNYKFILIILFITVLFNPVNALYDKTITADLVFDNGKLTIENIEISYGVAVTEKSQGQIVAYLTNGSTTIYNYPIRNSIYTNDLTDYMPLTIPYMSGTKFLAVSNNSENLLAGKLSEVDVEQIFKLFCIEVGSAKNDPDCKQAEVKPETTQPQPPKNQVCVSSVFVNGECADKTMAKIQENEALNEMRERMKQREDEKADAKKREAAALAPFGTIFGIRAEFVVLALVITLIIGGLLVKHYMKKKKHRGIYR